MWICYCSSWWPFEDEKSTSIAKTSFVDNETFEGIDVYHKKRRCW
ncbi:hypothetical protein [Candidatus Hodgkinia cicadicola]